MNNLGRLNGPGKEMIRRLLPALLLMLVGCGEPDNTGDSGSLKTYRHSMDGAPSSLDPAHASTIYANFLVVNLYDTLYRYRYLARPYEITPNLAESLPEISDDGLVYTIHLKRGVMFSDDPVFPNGEGREVLASDFVYSLKRHFDPATLSQGSWIWQDRIAGLDAWKENGSDYDRDVPGLSATGDHTIRIELTRPFPQLVHTLAQGFSAVVAPEAVRHYGREMSLHPVGSGPFRLTSFDSARATLERNPGFRKEIFRLAQEGFDPETQGGMNIESLEGLTPPFVDRIQVDFIGEDAGQPAAEPGHQGAATDDCHAPQGLHGDMHALQLFIRYA